MLAHLDKNHLSLEGGVRQDELYEMIVRIAGREFTTERIPPRTRRRHGIFRHEADHQVQELGKWLRARTDRVRRGERPITYRQLRPVLKRFGYELGDRRPGNLVEILKEEKERVGVLRRDTRTVLKTMKELRRLCKLTEEDGVHSEAFYDGADVVDAFVNQYRTVLRRLAKT
jgi:death-on-curing protein